MMLSKVLVQFTNWFLLLKKFSIEYSFFFSFLPHFEVIFPLYSIHTKHYFLVVATSKAADYSIYDISPSTHRHYVLHTHTMFTFIFLFPVFLSFFFLTNLSSDCYFFFFYSLMLLVFIVVVTCI